MQKSFQPPELHKVGYACVSTEDQSLALQIDALVADGIPFTSFAVNDVGREYQRLRSAGVRFTQPPVEMGPVTTAVFDDTCGNLIQIATKK